MPEFTGFVQLIPQTEEEEFEGRALILSKFINDSEKVDEWFEYNKEFDPRFGNRTYRDSLKTRAEKLSQRRKGIMRGLPEIISFLEDSCSFDNGCCLIKTNTDSYSLEIEYFGERYIISVKSKDGLEEI